MTQFGLIEDRSLSGVSISVPQAIAIGSKVKIQGRARELAGMVRYCRLKGDSYYIGIRLDSEDAAWNRFGGGL